MSLNLINKLPAALLAMAMTSSLLISSCAETPPMKDDPAALFKEAQEEVANDHYLLAIDKLREIKNKFAYSKYAVDAQLMLGDVYFLQESYPEAASVYESFRDLHPKHEKIGHALFRIGKCYFKDTPEEISRDLASAQTGITAYQDFLRRFPADALAAEARQDVASLEGRLAEKERRVGDFYAKRGHLQAARARWTRVVGGFPKSDAAEKARKSLSKDADQSSDGERP